MGKAVVFPFPLGGLDTNWAYTNQPKDTSPDLRNVRAYSVDEERARGGTRPGLAVGHSLNGETQWVDWFDTGWGSSTFYEDDFEYTGTTALNAVPDTGWSAAGAALEHKNGEVHLGSTASDVDSGAYTGIVASDHWDDFKLTAGARWNNPTDGKILFYVGSTSTGTNGCQAWVEVENEYIGFPQSAYLMTMTLGLQVGGSTKRRSFNYGASAAERAGTLTVEADEKNVHLYWENESGRAEISKPRAGQTCSKAGFQLTKSNPKPGSISSDFIDVFVSEWALDAKTRPIPSERKLGAIAGGVLYTGATSLTSRGSVGATSGGMAAAHGGRLCIVNGSTPYLYDPVGSTVTAWESRKGEMIQDATLVCNWRNRVVLSGSQGDPANWYMSRQDDAHDWDYGHDDAQSAVAGALGQMGKVQDTITALCPLTDNQLVIGCVQSVWVMRGDPMEGGVLQRRSDGVGIVGKHAWCQDPQGNMYFVGPEGFYAMAPNGRPQNLTSKRIPALTDFNPNDYHISCAYDVERHGVNLFITPTTVVAATHYFYDIRNNAFFPERYTTNHDPTCAGVFYNDDPSLRKLLLGSRAGGLYVFDDNSAYDATGSTSVAISSYAWCQPKRLAGMMHDSIINRTMGTLSSTSSNVLWELHAADTLETVTDGTAKTTGIWSAGRNQDDRTRVRGGAHALKLANSGTGSWALESAVCEAVPAGRHRV